MLLIAAPFVYSYHESLYPSWEYALFMWLYSMCLSKLVAFVVAPEEHDKITQRTIFIICLIGTAMYYTQIKFGQEEWMGIILLIIGVVRVPFSIDFFFLPYKNPVVCLEENIFLPDIRQFSSNHTQHKE